MSHNNGPISLALIENAFKSSNYPCLFSGEDTHDPARDLIAQLIAYTDDEDLLFAIVRSGLPDNYEGNTLQEIPAMIKGALAKGFQNRSEDDPSLVSETIASRVLAHAFEGDVEYFHNENKKTFVSLFTESRGVRTIALTSGDARSWLRAKYYANYRQALPERPLNDALATLQAKALFEGNEQVVAVRISRHKNCVYIDLGRPDGLIAEIDENGWRVVQRAPVKFWRPPGLGELPLPTEGGDISAIKALLNLEDQSWHRVLGFMLNSVRPQGPYFCLLIDGEQGSGKSSLCSVLKRIIDPGRIENLPPPNSDEQLMIQAKDCHLLVFDNASSLRNDISDAFCRLSTGAAFAKRKLYSDDDVHILTSCIPFIINGIGEFVYRPDLLERSIIVSLPTMPENSRRGLDQIFTELDSALPGILGSLYTLIAVALRNEADVTRPTNIRMADAAAWLAAAEPGTGLPPGTLLSAIVQSQEQSVIDRIRENSLVISLEAVIANGSYEGRMGDLYQVVRAAVDRPDRSFPRTAAHLSNHLQRLKPAMAKIGIFVELERRDREGRSVRIWREGQNPLQPINEPWRKW